MSVRDLCLDFQNEAERQAGIGAHTILVGHSRKSHAPRGMLRKIRSSVANGSYDVTLHAIEEMQADELDILDIESAILTGRIVKSLRDDLRRMRYTIHGFASDGVSSMATVGRYTESGRFLIITVYRLAEAGS